MEMVESLIVQHQDYVRSLARGIAKKLPRQVEFEELVALGQLGLVTAARQFEPGRGVAFATFAYYRIRGAILDGLRQMAWLPPSVRRKVSAMGAQNQVVEGTVEGAEGSNDPEFLAKQFHTAIGRLGAVFLLARQGEGEEDESLEPATEETPATAAEEREQAALLKIALEKLEPEHRDLIRMIYFEHKSMTEIGQLLQKNKSTISRRHADAIDALRGLLSETAAPRAAREVGARK